MSFYIKQQASLLYLLKKSFKQWLIVWQNDKVLMNEWLSIRSHNSVVWWGKKPQDQNMQGKKPFPENLTLQTMKGSAFIQKSTEDHAFL